MYPSLVAITLALFASAARAEDVTLFVVGRESGTADGIIPESAVSISLIGASPVSVDEAGATHYAYSQLVSWKGSDLTESAVMTQTATFQADATRFLQELTTSAPGDSVLETKLECVHLENGTSVCHNAIVGKGDNSTFTLLDTIYTGTPSAWVTIKNVETALPSDDQGGAENAWGRGSFCVVLASLGVGAALVLL